MTYPTFWPETWWNLKLHEDLGERKLFLIHDANLTSQTRVQAFLEQRQTQSGCFHAFFTKKSSYLLRHVLWQLGPLSLSLSQARINVPSPRFLTPTVKVKCDATNMKVSSWVEAWKQPLCVCCCSKEAWTRVCDVRDSGIDKVYTFTTFDSPQQE